MLQMLILKKGNKHFWKNKEYAVNVKFVNGNNGLKVLIVNSIL